MSILYYIYLVLENIKRIFLFITEFIIKKIIICCIRYINKKIIFYYSYLKQKVYKFNEGRFHNVKKQNKKIYWYLNNGVFFSNTY